MRLRVQMLIVLLLVISGVWPDVAKAAVVLWYNGDVHIGPLGTGGGGTVNEETTNRGPFNIYDDFIVTDPGGWTIQRVWSNNSMQVTGVTQATWSIRSGMGVGNGGTVIAGGTSSATQTPTGRINPSPGFPEYAIEVSGLNVFLTPGTYWLSVSPLVGVDTGGVFKSYNSTTFGANAIGTPPGNNANSLLDSPFLSRDFSDAFGNDFSMGVAGIAGSSAIPEPSSLAIMGVGLICLAGDAWRRRQQRKTA